MPTFDQGKRHDYLHPMWLLKNPSLVEVTYDRTDAGLGVEGDHALYFDEVEFANAISSTSWGEGTFQAMICRGCGIEGCEAGGWLSLMRAGDFVVFPPLFEDMLTEDIDMTPPKYAKGTPYMSIEGYEELRTLLPGLPEIAQLNTMSGSDAFCLWRWETPFRLLGRNEDGLQLREDLLLLGDEGVAALKARICKVSDALILGGRVEMHLTRGVPCLLWLDMKGSPSVEIMEQVDGHDHALVDGLALISID